MRRLSTSGRTASSDAVEPVDVASTASDGLPAELEYPIGQLARWRRRAELAADQYQFRAQQRPWLGLPLAFLARYAARQGALLASATAFRLFLWLLPLALLTTAAFAAVVDDAGRQLEDAGRAAGITTPVREQLLSSLHEAHRSWWIAAALGTVLLVWTTRALVRTLALVHAHIWGIPTPRQPQRQVLVTGLALDAVLLVVVLAATFVGTSSHLEVLRQVVGVPLRIAAVAGGWVLICRRLPSRSLRTRDLVPGCVLFGIGMVAVDAVGRLFLPAHFARSSALYGSLGTAAVLLAWLLVIGHLIVATSFVHVVWSDYRRQQPPSA
jgi:uncharacterized BrkB/YihY/UPF0761 family membrane protein